MKEELLVEEQPLSAEERSALRKKAFSTIIVAIVLVAVTAYVIFSSFMNANGISFVAIIFFLFFLVVLSFIIVVRLQNTRATTKIIYTGVVQEKKTESMQTRGNAPNESYLALVGDKWFTVEQEFYEKLHAGETVKLHTLGSSQVFKVEHLHVPESSHVHQAHVHQAHQRNAYHSSMAFDNLDAKDRRFVRTAFFKSLFFRTILGGVTAYIVFYLVFGIAVLATGISFELMPFLFWADLLIICSVFFLLNVRTVRLLADLQSGVKIVAQERLIDKVRSNVLKPGPRSAVSTKRYGTHVPAYCYFQTENRWIQVSEETFNYYEGGMPVPVITTKHARLVLSVGEYAS